MQRMSLTRLRTQPIVPSIRTTQAHDVWSTSLSSPQRKPYWIRMTSSNTKINKPYVAAFTKFQFLTKVRCGDTSYTFPGVLDYRVGFISAKLKGKLVVYPSLVSYFIEIWNKMARYTVCGWWCAVWAQQCIEWHHRSKEPWRIPKCPTPEFWL